MTTLHDELETGCVTDAAGFTSIVVALDLESGGDHALPVARVLAEQGGVPVELLTVSSPNVDEDIDVFELTQRLRENGWPDDSYLIVHDNHPAQAIVDVIEAPQPPCSSWPLERHCAGPLRGSVVDEVLAAIDQPVLLVGPHVPALGDVAAADTCRLHRPYRRSGHGRSGGRPLGRHVRRHRHLGHRGGPDRTAGTSPGDSSSEHVRHFARLLAEVGVESSWGVLHGDEPDVRLEEFGTRLRDPIFVSTSGRWTDGRLHWHSTTRQLVRRSTRPVLVVPADPTPRTT